MSLFEKIRGYWKPLRADRAKRASPCAFLAASVTVEASIALPLYLFFFANILTAFDILRMQCDLTAALHQTGNAIAAHAFDLKYAGEMAEGLKGNDDETGGGTDAGTAVASLVYAESRVRSYLGSEYLSRSVVQGGSGGLSFLQSQIMHRADEIDLVVSYKVKPFFPGIAAFAAYPAQARYFGHAWTGYEPGGAGMAMNPEDDPIVYITETGTVYHRNLNCSHLKHAVRAVSAEEALAAVNGSGERYTPCEICGGFLGGHGVVYISEGGNRIHSSVNCPGLKRTIFYIHLSEVGGRPPCSKCGW